MSTQNATRMNDNTSAEIGAEAVTFHLPTMCHPHLIKQHPVPKCMLVPQPSFQVCQLDRQSSPRHRACESCSPRSKCIDTGIDPVEESRDGWEEGWLEDRDIFEDSEGITCRVADSSASAVKKYFHGATKDMGHEEVRDSRVGWCEDVIDF